MSGTSDTENMGSAKYQLLKAVQHSDRNGAVRSPRNLPGKLASAHLIRAHLCGVILIGKGGTINVEGNRMFDRVHAVCSEVDARTQAGFLVLFRGSLEFISGGKVQTLRAVNLNRVMAIGRKDNKTVRIISVIRGPHTIGKYLVRSCQNPRANNGRGVCSSGGGRLCSSGESRHAEKSEKRETSDLHTANVAIIRGPHNLIVLNAWLSENYVFRPGWQKCR